MSTFRKAARSQSYIKIAIEGVSGAGKTYSSILIARGLGARVALIDTENGSGELYSDLAEYDYLRLEPPFAPAKAVQAIKDAANEGYDVIVIDSFSHYWKYILQFKETLDQQPRSNSFTNWGKVKPMYEELKSAILHCPLHVICCLRSKAEYVQQRDADGRSRIEKVGVNPITEPENEYEFTTVFTIERTHQAVASKDRTGLFDGSVPFTPSMETGKKVLDWLYAATGGQFTVPAEWSEVVKGSDEARASHDEAARLGVGVEETKELPAANPRGRAFAILHEMKLPPHEGDAKGLYYIAFGKVLGRDFDTLRGVTDPEWQKIANWLKAVKNGEAKMPNAFREWLDKAEAEAKAKEAAPAALEVVEAQVVPEAVQSSAEPATAPTAEDAADPFADEEAEQIKTSKELIGAIATHTELIQKIDELSALYLWPTWEQSPLECGVVWKGIVNVDREKKLTAITKLTQLDTDDLQKILAFYLEYAEKKHPVPEAFAKWQREQAAEKKAGAA